MKQIDIGRIRELASKATPGPWRWDVHRRFIESDQDDDIRPKDLRVEHGASGDTWCEITDSDANLIAESRNALPALLGEVEGLRAEVAALRGAAIQAANVAYNMSGVDLTEANRKRIVDILDPAILKAKAALTTEETKTE